MPVRPPTSLPLPPSAFLLSAFLVSAVLLPSAACHEGAPTPSSSPEAGESVGADGSTPDAAAGDAPSGASPIAPWVQTYEGDVEIDGLASDAESNVYGAGYFVGHASFGAHGMDSVASASGTPTKDIFVTKHARAGGAVAWARHFGGSGAEGNVYDLVAGGGLVVMSGAFSGSVDFDGTVLTATASAGSGSASSGTYGNAFLAAVDHDGRVRWAHQAGGDVLSGGNEIATSPSGGFVQVGIFGRDGNTGTLRLDGRDIPFTGGVYDSYVAALSAEGRVTWAAPIGGSGAQRGKAIATDPAGNVLVAGDAWDGETRFDGDHAFTSGAQDFWVASYDPTGHLRWARSFSSAGVDEVKGVGCDSAGNVSIAAAFSGPSIDLGGVTVTARPGATRTGLVFALSPDGSRVLWHNTISQVTKCCELEVDGRGHTFTSNAAVGPTVVYGDGAPFALGGAPRGGLLTELDGTGRRVGSWTVTGSAVELGELTLLANEAVAVAGSFEGSELRYGDIVVTGRSARTQFVMSTPPLR